MPDFLTRYAQFTGLFLLLTIGLAASAAVCVIGGCYLQALWGHPYPLYFPYVGITLWILVLCAFFAWLEGR